MSTNELACTYAALILHDEGLEITAEKITSLTKAAKVDVEAFYPMLFAKFLEASPMGGLLTNVGGSAAPAGAPAAAAAAGDAAEAPKEEKKAAAPAEESDEGMDDFGLFD